MKSTREIKKMEEREKGEKIERENEKVRDEKERESKRETIKK